MEIKQLLRKSLLMTFLGSSHPSMGQVFSSQSLSLPNAGDSFERIGIAWTPVPKSEKNQYWDLSEVEVLEDRKRVECLLSSEDGKTFELCSGATKFSYVFDENSQYMTKTENKITSVSYEQPELQLRYPCVYQDSVSRPFRGKVVCGDKERGPFEGTVHVKVDALDCVMFPNGIRLDSLLRVHHEKSFSYGGSTIWVDSYRWYSQHVPYPLLEHVETKDLARTLHMESWYCPGLVSLVGDRTMESTGKIQSAKSRSGSNEKSVSSLRNEASCTVARIVDDKVTVSFYLPTEGEVEYSLCQSNGMVLEHRKLGPLPAGYYQEKVKLPSIGNGVYIMSYVINGAKGSVKLIDKGK